MTTTGGSSDPKSEFEAAALPHLQALFNFAVSLTRNREKAEDLVQDAYLRAFRAYATFTPGTNIKAWLFQILKNVHINAYRSGKAHPEEVAWEAIDGGLDAASPVETPEAAVMNGLLHGEVQEALDAIPVEYREVVVLAFAEEMSYREIADVLRIPIGTVMSRLHRGRKLLQARLLEFASRRGIVGRRDEPGKW